MHMMKNKPNRYQLNQADYGLKKLSTQMTELEKDFLMRKFRSVRKNDWTMTQYALQRFTQRGIDGKHFLTLWNNDAELIEYHFKKGSNRILLRSKAIHNGAQVCAVFAPDQKAIITVYLNYHENKHKDIKLEFYNKDLDILTQYRKGRV